MRNFFAAILLALFLTTIQFAQSNEINIIPKPASITPANGSFTLNRNTVIVAKERDNRRSAEILVSQLRAVGLQPKIVSKPPLQNYIQFLPPNLAIQHGAIPRAQSFYGLQVEPTCVRIEGFDRGQFYGIQTLMQMLPIESGATATIPAVRILDTPRFDYRGMHLDVARHFQPVEFVKKFIDQMAQYKFNYFHWHLTEDQGWRIEIKKYPRLTEIGSKRPETMKDRNFAPYVGDGIPHGGFYTQEQIKDVVAYAKARHITVIPEIELPGHASAALAAYPQFGCKADYQYKVQTTWGIFKEVFCPTEETFKFLEDVLDETIALFPDSPYIHIGGDEVLKDHWKESPFVQELKKRENLKDEHEVQSYFIRRIEKFINAKGKKMIGWDEILEGGLAPNATVMSWRGMKGGIEAAKSKHDVIMTPTDYVYFDYGQGDPAYEPLNIGSYVPLEKVYAFEPVPPELTADEAKYIIGGQANVWTEYMKTSSHVEYMAFPRMLALSEVLWSKKEDRDFGDFRRRLYINFPRLDKQNVNYRIPEPAGLRNTVTEDEVVKIDLMPHVRMRQIYYTTDGSTPTDGSRAYYRPFEITLKEGEIKTLKVIVENEAGRKSSVYAATIIRGKMYEAMENEEAKPGVAVYIHTGFEGGSFTGESKSILLDQFEKRHDLPGSFELRFAGYFVAPSDGIYEFQIESTGASSFTMHGITIKVEGGGSRAVRSAIVPLKKGLHPFDLNHYYRRSKDTLRLRWGIKGQGLRQAYGGEFVH